MVSQKEESNSIGSFHDEKEIEQVHQPVNTGAVTNEEYKSEHQRAVEQGTVKFTWSSLWKPAVINPINGKSTTFNILRVWDPYAVAFWLATLGFFSAFFSWFAFSPLVPEAVKADLKLTPVQVINSNLASLGGTAIVRFIAGPCCDRFGPRKVMAFLLIAGAIPSALVPTISNIGGLETIRFFISILGGTFVPTQVWTTTFFDRRIVGTANAFAGGWGNLGGGVTPAVMIGVFERLVKSGLSQHLAWRICFLIVPVPMLLMVAALCMLLGKDCPQGAWSARHKTEGTAIEVARGDMPHLDASERRAMDDAQPSNNEKAISKGADFADMSRGEVLAMDTAVAEPISFAVMGKVLTDARVWLCALAYMTTFGLETAMDAALPGLILTLFQSPNFKVDDAAYVASTYGLLNLFARALGGIAADVLYSRYGLIAKVYLLIGTGLAQGVLMIGLGFYVNNGATLGGVIGFMVGLGITGFAANGAAYAVYSHLRPRNIGVVAGLVGGFGNIGGLIYTAIFRQHPGARTALVNTLGTKFSIAGYFNVGAILVPAVMVAITGLGDAR
ncbi:unnamed protein product [Tilletia laevis]|uniref:Major facilitator superfamily (MFS) profile domain-containing protein n=2 Tax=Tilletia TaxID=13289 RepID=A0A177VGV9_9BASI|nr:hypothetical protein CF336_g859 [Tilletia laevis]KAE8264917.1 hypothetical protein A4X03_0g604 [Tilletia caries]CAD6973109.1 unnamed protein product [Tilletia controversa]KAE8208289.1 hypothetical protein CF335_g516 [Tilletia laevis]CAD6891452.1 unnamed protein product [Tilletia caries]